ncbi:hypothetical protein [Streptomyces prasinus]
MAPTARRALQPKAFRAPPGRRADLLQLRKRTVQHLGAQNWHGNP